MRRLAALYRYVTAPGSVNLCRDYPLITTQGGSSGNINTQSAPPKTKPLGQWLLRNSPSASSYNNYLALYSNHRWAARQLVARFTADPPRRHRIQRRQIGTRHSRSITFKVTRTLLAATPQAPMLTKQPNAGRTYSRTKRRTTSNRTPIILLTLEDCSSETPPFKRRTAKLHRRRPMPSFCRSRAASSAVKKRTKRTPAEAPRIRPAAFVLRAKRRRPLCKSAPKKRLAGLRDTRWYLFPGDASWAAAGFRSRSSEHRWLRHDFPLYKKRPALPITNSSCSLWKPHLKAPRLA